MENTQFEKYDKEIEELYIFPLPEDFETTLIQEKKEKEYSKLMDKLEKQGEEKCIELLPTIFTNLNKLTNQNVNLSCKPKTDENKETENIMQTLLEFMKDGDAEFKEKMGRNMTYSEMRQLYG